MFCKNCGKSISESAKFCDSCGSSVSTSIPTAMMQESSKENNLKGLGGWLIFVILGLLYTVGMRAYGAYGSVVIFTDGTIDALGNPSSEMYIPGIAGMIKFEFVGEVVFLAVGIYLLYLLFNKRKNFPKYYIMFLASAIAFVLIDYALLASISTSSELQKAFDESLLEQANEITKAVIGGLIWIAYMKKSRRVKATFIEE